MPVYKNHRSDKVKEFRVATFNVRGLNDEIKRRSLKEDVDRYGVDVCCLQETKIKDGIEESIDNYELCSFETGQKAYGLGFIINKKWSSRIHRKWKVDDRMAIIQLNPIIKDQKKDEKTDLHITKNEKRDKIKDKDKKQQTIHNDYKLLCTTLGLNENRSKNNRKIL